jgi:hypothetical protein
MRSKELVVASWLVIAVAIGAGERASAEEFRNEAGKFRFQAPQDWVRFNALKMAEVRKADRGQPGLIIHECFEPRGLRPGFDGAELPFLIVMEDRKAMNQFQTYDSIERSLDQEFRRGFGQAAGPNVKMGAIKLDRAKNRVTADFDMTAPNGVRMRGVFYGFLGKHALVSILCFAREGELPQQRATFDAAADSFRFDPGAEFVPFDLTKFGLAIGAMGACSCAIVLLVVAVGGVMLIKLSR